MKFAITTNANLYARSLSLYAAETGKTIGQAVAREGPDFRTELFRQFRNIHPVPQSISDAAQARGFRVRRLNNTFLVKTENGLNTRAVNRAKELLGGQKSELFRPMAGGLAPVRFSSRRGNRRLQGARTGWRFAKSALRAYQLPAHVLANRLEEDRKLGTGIRALNLRALSVYLELLYRKRAAHGGTMAVQWLFKNYKYSPKGTYKTGTLIQRSVTNLPIGTLDFETDLNGNLQTIVFNGYVPGTAEQDQKHGVVSKVFGVRAQRLLGAIQQHNAKLARQSGY